MNNVFNHIHRLKETISLAEKDRIIAPLEKKAQAEVAGIFREQGDLFLDKFEKFHKYQFVESVDPSDINKTLNDVFAATKLKFQRTLKNILTRTFDIGGKTVADDLQSNIAFNLENPRATQWIENRSATMITRIDETTRARIKNILEDSAKNGWNYSRTQKVIKNEFEDFAVKKPQKHIRNRAELVSVTENAMAFENGGSEAAMQLEDSGIPMVKYWSNTGDKRVSVGCLNNTAAGWISEKEMFPSGHQHAPRFPGCRCHVIHKVNEDEL